MIIVIIQHHHHLHHHFYSVDKGTYRKTKDIKIIIILKVSIQPRPQALFPGFGKAWEKRPGDEVGYN